MEYSQNEELNENNSLKKASKKILIISLIVLIITLILGLAFELNLKSDFYLTKTVWGKMMSDVDGTYPGAGEWTLISLAVSGATALAEIGALIMIMFAFFLIPVGSNVVFLIISIIARLFQIGKNKKWKDTTAKVLLIFSFILHGIFNIYLLILAFTGFVRLFIFVYLMLIINVYGLIKKIMLLKNVKNVDYDTADKVEE